jgi:hypothetical protein
MRTSADSLREQAARFFAMAEEAREEGKSDLANLLTEAARRAAAVEGTLPQPEQQETAVVEQQQETIQEGNPGHTLETAGELSH